MSAFDDAMGLMGMKESERYEFTLDNMLSKDLLDSISMKCSYGKSLNKLSINESLLNIVIADAHSYETVLQKFEFPTGINSRIKTPDSIIRKVKRHPDLRFQSVFNDILGLRIFVEDYPETYPEYFRVVDLTKGKLVDDGYRAVHLYYKKDNFHYPIEIQLWSEAHREFNEWSHSVGYKILTAEQLKEIYDSYKAGYIVNINDYVREVNNLYG